MPYEESIRRSVNEDDEMTRRTLLLDLRQMEMQGVKLTKEWTIHDRAEDMTHELRRITLSMDEASNIGMMRDGLRLGVTAIEMMNKRIGLLDLDGWSNEICRDLGKHDANLGRIYRKYWRRSHSTSPEMEICMSLVGSMGMYHMKRKMSSQVFGGGEKGSFPFPSFTKKRDAKRPPTPDSSDDEDLPP